VELPEALELIAAKKQADLDRILRTWDDSDVQILKGRWGPFISDGKKNARMPKEREVESMTLEECMAALEAAPDKRRGKKASKKKTAKKKTAKKKATRKRSKKTAARKKTARATATTQ
jgi:DNA topoisomerase-1